MDHIVSRNPVSNENTENRGIENEIGQIQASGFTLSG
jgi:hypothetical protein